MVEALDGREAKCALERFQRHTAERRQRMRGHVSHVGRDSARERGSERAAASRSGRGFSVRQSTARRHRRVVRRRSDAEDPVQRSNGRLRLACGRAFSMARFAMRAEDSLAY